MAFPRMTLARLVPAIAGLALLAAPVEARILAVVEGVDITDEDVAIAMDDIGPTLPQDMQGPDRDKYVLDYLIDLKLVARKAEAEKLVNDADFARRMTYYRDKVFMEGAFSGLSKQVNTEAALRKVYDDVSKAQKPESEVHARHILVPSEDQAKAALRRLQGGEDFAKVAKELSQDPGSEGGDLGWFTRDQMVPEFAEAAFKMTRPGELSQPVQSQFGWHVIRLEERRDRPFPPFEAVRDQVARYAVQKNQSDYIAKLRQAAKVERIESAPAPLPIPAPK